MNNKENFYEKFYRSRITRGWVRDLFEVTEHLINYNVIQLLEKKGLRGADIIDVGCGRGQLTCKLRPFGKVTGVDYSNVAIESCKKRYPDIHFEQANILDDTWVDQHREMYDVVTSSEVIEHIPQEQQAIFARNLNALRKPGGTIILTTPNRPTIDLMKPDNNMSNEEFYKLFEGQPEANLLSKDELTILFKESDQHVQLLEISPLIRPRFLDLLLKGLSLPKRYTWLQYIQKRYGLPGKVIVLHME
jgi:2-polyprenyl-3-methyl-5-hydroxy-6-metoxy-1,4-benzoquinol methylase